MFNFKDNSSPTERYNAVYDTALKGVSQRRATIRNNSFGTEGELAHNLARLGAQVVNPMINDTNRYLMLDVRSEYVLAGGNIALDLLERVIHPSNGIYGPGNFSVKPCDSAGLDLKEVKMPNVLDETSSDIILGKRKHYWLGMRREEVFSVTAIGIGLALAKEAVTVKRSVKAATKEAESDRWLNYAQSAISYAAEMALSVVQLQDAGNSYRSAFVSVEPLVGRDGEGLTLNPIEISRFSLD